MGGGAAPCLASDGGVCTPILPPAWGSPARLPDRACASAAAAAACEAAAGWVVHVPVRRAASTRGGWGRNHCCAPILGAVPSLSTGYSVQGGSGSTQGQQGNLAPAGISQHQVCMRAAPGAARSDHGYQQGGGDRQCCQCRCPEHLVVLCCPLGEAAGTLTDASANFTDSMKEEAARGLAAQQVSRGSATPGTGLVEPGFAPPPNCVPAPWETSLSPSVFVPLEQPPGPQRKWGH